jgi:hypothetical protein
VVATGVLILAAYLNKLLRSVKRSRRRTMSSTDAHPGDAERAAGSVVDWSDLGREMWSFLTGRRAAISYEFVDMAVEVPRDTGPQAPRATWKIDGTLRISSEDDSTRGA